MPVVRAYDQVSGGSVQVGLAGLGANVTLLKAKLSCYTWFFSENTANVVQTAPPNTLLGISWRAAGTAPELITTANWTDNTWYHAGPGEMTAMDRWAFVDTTATPHNVFVMHTYATTIEAEYPLFSAVSMSPGISINFLGQGFWSNVSTFLSYQFEAWYD